MNEYWLPIPDYPDYAVSNLGRVMRCTARTCAKAGTTLRIKRASKRKDWHWYPSVAMFCNGVRKQRPVHRLVAEAFLGPCPVGMEVNHKNGNIEDARAVNLEYVTRQENIQHAVDIGLKLSTRGERHGRARLTEEDVRTIRAEYTGKYGEKAAFARRYGVSHGAIQHVVEGRNWVGL